MKAMVGELATLVGRTGIDDKMESSAVTAASITEIHNDREAAIPAKKHSSSAMVAHRSEEVRPEQVIPVDDEDFKEF